MKPATTTTSTTTTSTTTTSLHKNDEEVVPRSLAFNQVSHFRLLRRMAMAIAAPALSPSCAAPRAPASGSGRSKSLQRMSVGILQARVWPSHVSGRRPVVCADYSDRRGGGAGDFVAGFLLGGAVFGALGYILAPQISKSLEEGDSVKDEGTAAKRPARYLEDDEGLEKTRETLNEKIAQLNAAIDNVSAQLRTEEGLGNPNSNNVELESPA